MMSFIDAGLDGIGSSSCLRSWKARPFPGAGRSPASGSLDADAIARIAFALLCVATAIGFFVYPTYPNYDSYYSLLWGREVLDLQLPGFEGFRVPTEHPLAIVAGMVFSPLPGGDRLFIAAILASFLWLIWGVYRLGRTAFTPLVGGVAAVLTLTRFDFGFLAARGYIDIPYMAIVVWAAALEAARPRRGVPVLLLLAAAGLLRPEAWVLSGLYWLWLAWRATWKDRVLTPCWPPSGRSCGRSPTWSSPATRCSRSCTRAARRRTSGASARCPSSRRRSPISSTCS